MGYEYWPEALEATIRRAWEVTGQVPVLVTENGIGTDDDDQRIGYVRAALEGVARLPRRRHRRPRLHVLVAARQLRVGVRLRPPFRARRRRPGRTHSRGASSRARGGTPTSYVRTRLH